jgi:PAS domain S-box-containing protein
MTLENAIWLVDRLGVPASLHDLNGVFVHTNRGGAEASGFTNVELIGRTYLDLVPESERANIRAQFTRAAAGKPSDFGTIFTDAEGHVRGTRAQHLPIIDDGSVIGVLIIAFEFFPVPLPWRGGVPQLTARQHEVLSLIAAGLSTAETAQRLTLSTETVRNHLRGAYKELGVHTRVEAVAVAHRLGLLAASPLGPSKPA